MWTTPETKAFASAAARVMDPSNGTSSMGTNMDRTRDDAILSGQTIKPRWRTPELLQDKLVDATNIDTKGAGDDHVTSYGTPNVNHS